MPSNSYSPHAPGTIGATQVERIWELMAEKKLPLDVVRPSHLRFGFTVQQLGKPVLTVMHEFSEGQGVWMIQTLQLP